MANSKKPSSRSGSMMKALLVGDELDPLTITGVSVDDPDGVVPINYLLNPLEVFIAAWLPATSVDDPLQTLDLRELSDDGDRSLVTREFRYPALTTPAAQRLEIPLALLRRRTRIAYLFYTVTNSGGTSSSPKRKVLIDLEEPRFLSPTDRARFVVPPAPAVNDAYLNANPRVGFYIPIFNVMARGDRIQFFLANVPNAPIAAPDGEDLLNTGSLPWTASLPAAAFRKLNKGNAYVRIRIVDATGNISLLSADLDFVVDFAGPIPSGTLAAPVVQNSLYGQRYLRCASQPPVTDGVIWLIAPNINIVVGDFITFIWQGFDTNNWSNPLASVVFQTQVQWQQQHQVGGMRIVVQAFDTTLFPLRQFKSATGRYEVWRAGVKLGDSLEGFVRVDLTYPSGGYCSPRGIVFDK